ncbi:MAG TPA: tetratricopeptide repeat protein [Candidatus Tectomicrobia bacterium]|nr:tetratricopeptide repeat protein [Candidatus Tectomicrobia bacterium]
MSTRHVPSFLLLAALIAGCAAATEVTETQRLQARAAYERGLGHLNERQAAAALAAFREAVSVDPGEALYRDTLGVLLLDLGRPDLALEHLQQAVAIDPQFADAHFHLGTALAELGKWEEAATTYRAALSLPRLTVPELVHQNLGLALYHLKRYPEAESALRFAITLEPRLQAAYYNLGLVLLATQRAEEAKGVFRKAHELGAESPFGRAAAERLRALGEGG